MDDRTCKTCRWSDKPLDFARCQNCAQLKKGGGVEMANWEGEEKAPTSGAD